MLAEVRKRFIAPGGSVDDLCVLPGGAGAGAGGGGAGGGGGSKKTKPNPVRSKTRHVRWTRGSEYVFVGERGRDFCNLEELNAKWEAGEITLADMWVVRHKEAARLGARSQLNPLWEALYYVADAKQFYRVQKCHLRWAYERAGRTDAALAWSTLSDAPDVCYWCDRHAFSMLKIK